MAKAFLIQIFAFCFAYNIFGVKSVIYTSEWEVYTIKHIDSGLDPIIINNTCNTEDIGTATCFEGKHHDVENMATNFHLMAAGVENCCFSALGLSFPPNVIWLLL